MRFFWKHIVIPTIGIIKNEVKHLFRTTWIIDCSIPLRVSWRSEKDHIIILGSFENRPQLHLLDDVCLKINGLYYSRQSIWWREWTNASRTVWTSGNTETQIYTDQYIIAENTKSINLRNLTIPSLKPHHLHYSMRLG